MRNVLVDLHRLGGNEFNGLYHFCYQLGSHLLKVPAPGIDLHFYLPEKEKGIFGDRAQYTIQQSRDKIYRFGTGKFDVWHIATTLSWYRPFSRKTKNIFTIHDLNFLSEEEYTAKSKKKYLKLIQERVHRADHLTYISAFAKKQAEENLELGQKPYTIIHNGCNIPQSEELKIPGYTPQQPFLFTIGQAHSRKNFHVLPALLAGNDYELVIAGLNDFPYKEKIMEAAAKQGVSARVKMIGPVTEEEKYWYYKHCLAFIFPSIGEGFGLPVLEPMHFGRPVFLSDYTSLPEIGGDAAFYFTSFDPASMRQVFEQGMETYYREGMVEKIKRQAASFNWDKAAQKYITVYRAV